MSRMGDKNARAAQRQRRVMACAATLGGVFGTAVLFTIAGCAGPDQSRDFARIEHQCSSCHGIGGHSVSPNFPDLAGQQKNYIINQLSSFQYRTRNDPRANVYMWGMAASLTQSMIEQLASYYAAQPPAPGVAGDAADTAAGDIIYHHGLGENEIPACITCHGLHAEGDENHPRLAGQHRAYLERQLAYFRANFRYSQTMHHNTRNMTETEAREVATYLAAQ